MQTASSAISGGANVAGRPVRAEGILHRLHNTGEALHENVALC
ncbi:hypothetical protein THITH_04780 [Thioalkalivibrio paradoxus ARh 1]|uniref:Uncharacterized protein n=1 Tax=Thioalkalivibrio paradoxus ARh 1 TaxID=713585 RepID=W0DNB4_9GAMM|nr:hypothetical protein THITH_04780 [Thioalkalivibrio paradoxus ARh 1]